MLERAKNERLPYIAMPETGIQPRAALGYSCLALAKAIGKDDLVAELGRVSRDLDPKGIEQQGKELAESMYGYVPLIYASSRLAAVAYNWKIKFNETGKIPAFCNTFPELNHNEMHGFDLKEGGENRVGSFYCIMLKSEDDHPRTQRRMAILEKLYMERGLPVEGITVAGKTKFHALFSSIALADWASYYTAEKYGHEAEQVPMVEEFKRLMAA